MSVTTIHLDQPPDAIFAVMADPWRFADWVVGAKCIRAVDGTWPEPGSRFHHRFGFGRVTVDDSTVLEEIDPPRHLVLRARARPHGIARVRLELRATPDGGTDVEMEETPIAGFAKRAHNPVLDGVVTLRNRRSLRRLERLAREQRLDAPGSR